MNKNNAAAYLPLVQALADGKTIQYIDCGHWYDCNEDDGVLFSSGPSIYRIKPEEDHWGTSGAFAYGISLAKEENKITRNLLDKAVLATGSQFKIDSPFMKRFDVETECRALGIWPISLCMIPDSQLHIKNLQELVAKAIEHGKELPKDTPKDKTAWYRVADHNYGLTIVNNTQDEIMVQAVGFKRWLTDRIECDVM